MSNDADDRQPTLTHLAAAVDAAGSPLERLKALRNLAVAVDAATASAVEGARFQRSTWAEVADQLGVSRQAAHRRFAELTAAAQPTGLVEKRPKQPQRPEWELRVGPGRGLRAGRIVRRT